jgi:hypothetical protein
LGSVFSDRNKPIEKQIAKLQGLKYVGLVGYSGVDCLGFTSLSQLRAIALTQGRLQRLDGLEECQALEDISLAYLRNLTDIANLEKLVGLTDISLMSLPKVAGTISVSNYPLLQSLYIMSCKLSVDLSGLSKNQYLKKLALGVLHTNLNWDDLFSLRNLSTVGLIVDDSAPSDQELMDLSSKYGHALEKIERAGPRKKSHLRLFFSG